MAIRSFCFEKSDYVDHQMRLEVEKYITGEFNVRLLRINSPHEEDATIEFFLFNWEFEEFYKMMTFLKDLPGRECACQTDE
jgi:hypothetical protein